MKKIIMMILLLTGLSLIINAEDYKIGQFFAIFGDEHDWNYNIKTAPFDKTDYLYIAFLNVYLNDKTQKFPELSLLKFPLKKLPTQDERLKQLIKAARDKNPDIKILISLTYGYNDAEKKNDTRYKDTNPYKVIKEDPEYFADSVVKFLNKYKKEGYKIDGLDLDYESSCVIEQKDFDIIAFALNKKLKAENYLLTISPNTTKSLSVNTLDKCFDLINVQCYQYWHDWPNLIDEFVKLKYDKSKLTAGLMSEWGSMTSGPDNYMFPAEFVKKNKLAGIFAWRLDNDRDPNTSSVPTYETAIKMWKEMKQ